MCNDYCLKHHSIKISLTLVWKIREFFIRIGDCLIDILVIVKGGNGGNVGEKDGGGCL